MPVLKRKPIKVLKTTSPIALIPAAYGYADYDNPYFWEGESAYFNSNHNVLNAPPDTGKEESQPWYATLLTGVMSLYQQKKYADANAKRLQQGMAPVSPQEYAREQVPAARVVLGPDSSTKNLIMYGGIAVVGLVALSMLRKKGR